MKYHCPKCERDDLTRADFYVDLNRPNGLKGWCISCINTDNRNRYEPHPRATVEPKSPTIIAYHARVRMLKHRYGITIADYDRMFAEQDGKCAICLRERKLIIDHDHKTKKVRGLLCHACNTAIGKLGEDVQTIGRALVYVGEAA